MLVQVMALLSLGVLCSSAPMQATKLSPQEQRSRVESIIQELLEDIKKLNLSAVPSLLTLNTLMERCMYSYLTTFVDTLADLDMPSKNIARKMALLKTYESILPQDLDQEYTTAQVPAHVFLETLEVFLRLLYEKI